MLISTLTVKNQITLPEKIRRKLDLHPGDKLFFTIEERRATIQKITSFDEKYHKALSTQLSEWASEADEKGYHGL